MSRLRSALVAMIIGATAASLGLGAAIASEPDDAKTSAAPVAVESPTAAGLTVTDPWARASIMAELASAAFMTIHNSTGEDDALVGATSAAAGTVELHQTSAGADGAMAMAPVDSVLIPAGGDAILEPGGYHLMLIGLAEPLVEGASIELRLEFSSAEPQTITIPVRALGPMDHDDAQGDIEPELTWAPLVTLPPIAEPAISSPYELADGFSLGHPDAPVVVEVWEDFQCPFCQRFTLQVKPAIVSEFVESGDARLVFRSLAFLGEESRWAAVAASLAAEQNGFWPFHDYLFANLHGENVGSFDLDRLLEAAEASGLDMARFRSGMQLDAARERFVSIEAEARRDAGALGISATPTVVVNGVPLQVPSLEGVRAGILAALAAARATAPSAPPADPPVD